MKSYKFFALALLLLSGLAGNALAADTWTGGGTDNNWSADPANWLAGTTPASGDSLTFDGTTRLTPNNNFSGTFIISTLTFNSTAGAFTLGGNKVGLKAGVVDNSTNTETLNFGGTSSLSTNANQNFNVVSGGTLIVGGAWNGVGFGITTNNTGTVILSGSDSWTGATVVGKGTLIMTGASTGSAFTVGNNTGVATLSGNGSIGGAVTTATTGSNVAHLLPGATAALGSVGTLTLNGSLTIGTGTNLDFDLASTTTPGVGINDLIAMGGGTLTFGSSTTLNVNALGTLSTSGTYTLISGAGSIVNFNSANFTTLGIGALTATYTNTGTALEVSFSSGSSTPATAYFNGTTSDINTASNFYATPTGTAVSGAIGATTDVFFTATSGTGGSVLAPTVNSNVTINSITFTGTGTPATSSVVLSGTGTVTIGSSSGITVQSGAGNDTISAPVALGVSQTWTNNSTSTLSVSGVVSGSGFSLTKSGTGTLALSGANTYSGGTHIATGALFANNTSGSATGSGTLVLDNGAILGGTGTITTTGANTINGKVLVGQASASDLNTTSVLTMTSTGTTTFGATSNLVFNLNAANTQGNELQTGPTSSVILTGGMTFTLNLLPATGGPIVPNPTQYVLLVGTSGSGLGGTSFFGSGVTDTGGVLSGLNLVINSSQGPGYYANSYLALVGNNIDVEVVPEPSTWALMLGGFALLVVFQRARRSKDV